MTIRESQLRRHIRKARRLVESMRRDCEEIARSLDRMIAICREMPEREEARKAVRN